MLYISEVIKKGFEHIYGLGYVLALHRAISFYIGLLLKVQVGTPIEGPVRRELVQ